VATSFKNTIAFLLACWIGTAAFGQDGADSNKMAEAKLQKILSKTDQTFQSRRPKDTTLQLIEQLAAYDTALKRELYSYYTFGMQHRKRTFQWNLVSSMITFWVVVALVFAGISFAALQFYISMKEKLRKDDALNTQLEASLDGIKISSPVLGVIILVISLLFFYLYLVYVYPIQEIF
jgi:hypothetical protein